MSKLYRKYIKWKYDWNRKSQINNWNQTKPTYYNPVRPLMGFKCWNCDKTNLRFIEKEDFFKTFNGTQKEHCWLDYGGCGIDWAKTFEAHPLIKVLRYEEKILNNKREFAKIYNEAIKDLDDTT